MMVHWHRLLAMIEMKSQSDLRHVSFTGSSPMQLWRSFNVKPRAVTCAFVFSVSRTTSEVVTCEPHTVPRLS